AAAPGVIRAPAMAIGSLPLAAKTGGASPTPPMSTEPEPAACNIGGPEVKSLQLALNGSFLISPEACSSASAPVPFWSPMLSVTDETFTAPDDALPEEELDGELDDDDEQAATASTATVPVAASSTRPRLAWSEVIIFICFLVLFGSFYEAMWSG